MKFGIKLEKNISEEEIRKTLLKWREESKNEQLYPLVIGTYKNREKNILKYITRNDTPIYVVMYAEDFLDSKYNETYEFMKNLPEPNLIKSKINVYENEDDFYSEDIVKNIHIIRLKVKWRGILPKRNWIQKNLDLDKYWLIDDDIKDEAFLRNNKPLDCGVSRYVKIKIEEALKEVQAVTKSLKDEEWGCAGLGNQLTCSWFNFNILYRTESFNCACVLVNNKTLKANNIWYTLEPVDDDIKLCADILEAELKSIQCSWLAWETYYDTGTAANKNSSTMQIKYNEFALNNYVCMRDYLTLWIKKDKIKTKLVPKRIYAKQKIINDAYHNKLYELCKSGDCNAVYKFLSENKKS